jgi:hypothetical protein
MAKKGLLMETAMQERLTRLLDAYSHSYDIERDVTEEDSSWTATATYYLRDENYLISKQHVLSAVEQHEYLYFHVTDHLTAAELESLIDLSKRAGLCKVKPHKDHMFSNVGLVILANTIDPEAKKIIKKTRFRKNYRLSLWGWTEYQLAAMEVSANCFYANPAGAGARNIMEQNFAPKKGRK